MSQAASTAPFWWWVRHAPVPAAQGRFLGRSDPLPDLGDAARLHALAALLPAGARLLVSPARRARLTAAALVRGGFRPSAEVIEPDLAEQDFGAFDGLAYDHLARDAGEAYQALWRDPVRARPPGGESFAALARRVRRALRRHEADGAAAIVAAAHAGPIRVALARARGLPLADALAVAVPHLGLETAPRGAARKARTDSSRSHFAQANAADPCYSR